MAAKRKCVRRKTVRIKGHTRRVCASYGKKRKASKKRKSHGKPCRTAKGRFKRC